MSSIISGLRHAALQRTELSTSRREVMSPETARYYTRYISEFLKVCRDEDFSGNTLHVRNKLRDYLSSLQVVSTTKRLAAVVIGSFMREEGHLSPNDCETLLSWFKAQSSSWSDKALTEEQVAVVLIDLAGRIRNFTTLRDYYATAIMLATGARIGGLLGIKHNHVYTTQTGEISYILPKQKGAFDAPKFHEVSVPMNFTMHPFGELPFAQMHVMYAEQRDSLGGEHYFCNRSGEHISEDYYRGLFVKVRQRTGVPIHPHALRHSAGTRITQNVGVAQAAIVLDHARITTTQGYVSRKHIDSAGIIGKSFQKQGGTYDEVDAAPRY